MAHPFVEHREHKVQHSRVAARLKNYGTDQLQTTAEKLAHKVIKKHADGMRMEGNRTSHRMDRPSRASGGRVRKGGKSETNISINLAPPAQPPQPPMMMRPPMPPMPPGPPPGMPPGGPPGMPPPGGPPPGMGPPMRASGGRVKPGPGWIESEKLKTPVQHAPGKNDAKDIGRGKPITYANGGPVEAPKGKGGMGPKFHGGAQGGLGRLEKAKRAANHRP